MNNMKDGLMSLVLKVWRLFDNTAYICRTCGKLYNGVAARCHDGWACSKECYDNYVRDAQATDKCVMRKT